MKKIVLVLPIMALLAAGCGSSQPNPAGSQTTPTPNQTQQQTTNNNPSPTAAAMATPSASPTPSPTTTKIPVQSNIVVKIGSSVLGQYLVASNGMTLYYDNRDSANTSNCYAACAVNWPPYSVSAGLNLAGAAGINGKLGTITRTDGTTQLTYNGMPLYFWINDAKAGDTTGNNVNGFFVVKP